MNNNQNNCNSLDISQNSSVEQLLQQNLNRLKNDYTIDNIPNNIAHLEQQIDIINNNIENILEIYNNIRNL